MGNLCFLALGNDSGIFDLLVLVLVFVLILVAAYYVTKWVSTTGLNIQKNKNIKVLEVFRLNQSKYIYIIELGKKVVALGVSKDHIEYLTDLDMNELHITKPESKNTSFKSFLKLSKEKLDKSDPGYDDIYGESDWKEE